MVTDASGAIIEATDYYSYGGIRVDEQTGFNEQRKFAGHEYEGDTGLSYMEARYYNGSVGRRCFIEYLFPNRSGVMKDQAMSRMTIIGALLALVVLVGGYMVWQGLYKNSQLYEGDVVVQKVEQFRLKNGRLPKDLREIGILETNDGYLSYEKRGDVHYAVFLTEGFDDVWGYYSDTKQWENSYRK